MKEEKLEDIKKFTENLIGLKRAPSQFTIFLQLVRTGRSLSVKEMAEEIFLTEKATERAVAKLVDKGLVERSSFREGCYNVDTKRILLSLITITIVLYEDYTKNNK